MLDDKEFFYDLAKFEVEMISSRGSFLLIFQSMLFSTVVSIADKPTFVPIWSIIVLGLLSSLIWLYLNFLTYFVYSHAFLKLIEIDQRVAEIVQARKRQWLLRWGSVSVIMSFVFPILISIVWLIILWKNIC
jgi:hypothetical protein